MDIKALADSILSNIEKVIYGKPQKIRLIIAALLARGHILLDDISGTARPALRNRSLSR